MKVIFLKIFYKKSNVNWVKLINDEKEVKDIVEIELFLSLNK